MFGSHGTLLLRHQAPTAGRAMMQRHYDLVLSNGSHGADNALIWMIGDDTMDAITAVAPPSITVDRKQSDDGLRSPESHPAKRQMFHQNAISPMTR